MLKNLWIILAALVALALPAGAQEADAPLGPMQAILQAQAALIVKSSRKTIGPAIDAVAASGLPAAQGVLEAWQAKEMWQREADGLFFRGEEVDAKTYRLIDFDTGEAVGEDAVLRPQADQAQLGHPRAARHRTGDLPAAATPTGPGAPTRCCRSSATPTPTCSPRCAPRSSRRTDPELKARKQRLERLLTISYDPDPASPHRRHRARWRAISASTCAGR